MKILQLTRQFLPAQGGMESVVEGLSGALQRNGHTVQVATLRLLFSTGAMAPGGVGRSRPHSAPHAPLGPSPLSGGAGRAPDIRGYDLVHIHAIDFFVDYLSLLRMLHRIPLVVSTHGGFFHTEWARAFKEMYFKTVTRRSLGGVGAVVCVSQHDREMFSQDCASRRIRVIENGANIDGFWSLKKR